MRTPTLFCAILLCALAPAQAAMVNLPSGGRLPWSAANPGVVGSLQTFLQTPGGQGLLRSNPSLGGLLKLDMASPLQLALVGGMTAHLPEVLTPEAVLKAHAEAASALKNVIDAEAFQIVEAVSIGSLKADALAGYAKDLAPFGTAWPETERSVGRVADVARAAKAGRTMAAAKDMADALLAGLRMEDAEAVKQAAGSDAHSTRFQEEARRRQLVRALLARLKTAQGAERQAVIKALKEAAGGPIDNARRLVVFGLIEDAQARLALRAEHDAILQALDAVEDVSKGSGRLIWSETRQRLDKLSQSAKGFDVSFDIISRIATIPAPGQTAASLPPSPYGGDEAILAQLSAAKGKKTAELIRSLGMRQGDWNVARNQKKIERLLDDAEQRLFDGDRANVILIVETVQRLAAGRDAAVMRAALKGLASLREAVYKREGLFGGIDEPLFELVLRGEAALAWNLRANGPAAKKDLDEASTNGLIDAASKASRLVSQRKNDEALLAVIALGDFGRKSASVGVKDAVVAELKRLEGIISGRRNFWGQRDTRLIRALLLWQIRVEASFPV